MRQHAQFAFLADTAEEMFINDALTPALPSTVEGWKIWGHLNARNALFGLQGIGAGHFEYYGFLAHSQKSEKDFVIVVRGTRLPLEWFEDMQVLLLPIIGPRVGMVHHGFWSIYDSMHYANVGDAVAINLIDGLNARIPTGANVTVVGHSMGAVLATYLATDLARASRYHDGGRRFEVHLVAFGSPRPGDSNFAVNVDVTIGRENYIVYNYTRDVVTHAPPSLPLGLGYQHLPNVHWITPGTAQAVVINQPGCNHECLSYAALIDGDAAELASSLCPECGINRRT